MTVTLLRGDALHLPLADDSVDLIGTSPPYFGLRSYTDGGVHYAGQLGSEATPTEFLDALLAATAEMRRVLKPSGSIFVNLGDKYATYAGNRSAGRTSLQGSTDRCRPVVPRKGGLDGGGEVPAKSLMLIPERYRIRCVDELGLIARAVLVWSKPNGLPESVTDRVRRSHEDWVHLTKAPRYYAAVDEIREDYSERVQDRQRYAGRALPPSNPYAPGDRSDVGNAAGILGFGQRGANPLGKLPGSVWTVATQPLTVPAELGVDHFAAFPMEWPRRLIRGWSPPGICTACGEGRRPVVDAVSLDMSRPQARRAHELATAAGLTEAHYAALLSVGVSDTGRGAATQTGTGKNTPEVYALANHARGVLGGYAREYLLRRPTSFRYVCACPEPTAPTRPAVVLDPFVGTGTVPLVADMLGRHGIGVDMSRDYLRLARWRTTDPGQRAAALQVEKPAPVAPAQDDLLDLLQRHPVDDVKPAGKCPAVDDAGRPCGRWDLPAAHVDGMHGAGKHRWPVTT